eukprot:TRINITY_DN7724_c0_g1_i1.p1 TRINITY_DN7724_c0_g1~~TRINITY_DN7724_c0_g1_i1.p1  ORF type:complete len:686 (+),score=171.86 TRINITY_DN7724_c0_g1_i1:123-2060(+)
MSDLKETLLLAIVVLALASNMLHVYMKDHEARPHSISHNVPHVRRAAPEGHRHRKSGHRHGKKHDVKIIQLDETQHQALKAPAPNPPPPSPPKIVKPEESEDQLVQEMLKLGDTSETSLLPNDQSERIWLFDSNPSTYRCLTRTESDLIFMDWCIENHFKKQQWVFAPSGLMGIRDPSGMEICLTYNKKKQLVSAECKAGNDEQIFEFQPTRGLVHKKTDYCVTAPRESYVQATVEKCKQPKKQWFMRVNNQIVPIGFEAWLSYFAKRRKANLDKYQQEINEVLVDRVARPVAPTVHRRCVVHFADNHHLGAAPQFRWWVQVWMQLKLNEPDQAFDLLIFGGKRVLDRVMQEGCSFKTLDEIPHPPPNGAPGVCWLIVFRGANEREPEVYDGWFNSIEILVNKQVRPLLEQYENLLRSDGDTFPSPRFRDYWLDYVYMGKNAAYSTRYARHKLANAAASAGLNYSSVTNIASTYYGPARTVLKIADLTVAVGKYLRFYLFAEGTPCKLPTSLRPKDAMCEWGSGLHEGVMLLYSQDVAVNHLLTTDEDIRLHPRSQYDAGTTNQVHVCSFLMYHIYHGGERFSKFAFQSNSYRNENMENYNLTQVRDYISWMALTANDQGKNSEVPYSKIGRDFSNLCDNWKGSH